MKKIFFRTVILVTVILYFSSCGGNSSAKKEENTKTEQTENVKYQCPMKCEGEKKYDKPGQCPVCNMALVKVEDTNMHKEHKH